MLIFFCNDFSELSKKQKICIISKVVNRAVFKEGHLCIIEIAVDLGQNPEGHHEKLILMWNQKSKLKQIVNDYLNKI